MSMIACSASRALRGLGLLVFTSAVALGAATGTPPASSPALPAALPPGVEITPPPPAPQGATPESLLPALIEHSRSFASIEGGRLRGPAADLLAALGARAEFVMIGEQHGSQGIADFATAYWADLAAAGFRYAALEADPWAVAALERELRAGGLDGWSRFLAARGGAAAIPFYSWASEARWVQAIVASQPRANAAGGPAAVPTLWGLDQVFLGSAPWLLADLARGAHGEAARALAGELATAAAAGDLQWLATSVPEPWEALRGHLTAPQDGSWAELVDALIASRRIYQPFTTGEGEALLANQERENAMRRLFLDQLTRAEVADGKPARVVLKFGANHLYRGASPVMVQALGGFVSELAAMRGGESLAILALCGPGGAVGGFDGSTTPCGGEGDDDLAFLTPYLQPDRVTVFDLRTWRLRPRRFAHLPVDVQRAVASFDLLVFPPSAPGATFLPGLAAPKVPGQ